MIEQDPTWDLLRRLLALAWDPGAIDPAEPIPWLEVVDLARSQGVTPLLRHAAHQLGQEIPGEASAALDGAYFAVARDNTLRFDALGAILAPLEDRGIPVLLLKGAALCETIYENIALRPMGDVDMLIPIDQLPVCRQILIDQGFVCTEAELAPGSQAEFRNQQAFVRREPSPLMIELHWHVVDVPYYMHRIPVEWFWDRALPRPLHGHRVHTLNPDTEMLYLAAHLALHHRFHGFRWFVDLAWLIHRQPLDWEAIVDTAAEQEWLLVLRETLERLAAHWPSLPLGEALGLLHARAPSSTEQRLFRLLTAEPRMPLLDFYTDLLCLPGWGDRLRFLWLNLFPQSEYMVRRYSIRRRAALPYWYLVRLGDGLGKALRTLPQALRLSRRSRPSP